MAFGVYVHIPYCLQRCTYCDFATYEKSQIMPPEQYTQLLFHEIETRAPLLGPRKLDTVYFGGGTPSLLPAENIVAILQKLASLGFVTGPGTEVTIEINPATLDENKMRLYLDHGINRFSVGAQTFHDPLLKSVNREHNSHQTIETLSFLKNHKVNYSFDVLFALPGQTIDLLKKDLDQVLAFRPNHVSPYCLTVPEGHVLSRNKLSEDIQVEMFELITNTLQSAGYMQYEISNFCLPGYESKHNSLYWDDEEYWGLGLSAHSYFKNTPWGSRLWNPNSIGLYEKQILDLHNKKFASISESYLQDHYEVLQIHQSVTDFCHTSLRRAKGLLQTEFLNKFGPHLLQQITPILAQQVEDGNLRHDSKSNSWSLTASGRLISNQVFSALTFLENELRT